MVFVTRPSPCKHPWTLSKLRFREDLSAKRDTTLHIIRQNQISQRQYALPLMIFRKFSICWNLENSLSMPSQWRPTAWWSFFRYSLRPTWITVDLWTAKWTLHSFIFHQVQVLVCYFIKLSVNRFHWHCLKVPLSLTQRKIMNSYSPIFY